MPLNPALSPEYRGEGELAPARNVYSRPDRTLDKRRGLNRLVGEIWAARAIGKPASFLTVPLDAG